MATRFVSISSSAANTLLCQLWIYPVKAFLGTKLQSSHLNRDGFKYDRCYMLLKVHKDASKPSGTRLENIHTAYFPDMALFTANYNPDKGTLQVDYRPQSETPGSLDKSLKIPLTPDVKTLRKIEVTMHKSPTIAYNMGSTYNSWFTERLGYEVVFAYVGENRRPVLGNLSPRAVAKGTTIAPPTSVTFGSRYWLSTILAAICAVMSVVVVTLPLGVAKFVGPISMVWIIYNLKSDDSTWMPAIEKTLRPLLDAIGLPEGESLTFADVAPYHIVTNTSLDDVSSRLPEGQSMDVRKFRPNIVISNASAPYDEDFWGELTVAGAKMDLTQNCGRCQSINIDYATGKPATDEKGTILKKMMSDRRVDKGTKYSPVFGRYAFVAPKSQGTLVKVGDVVKVSKRNAERMTFSKWCAIIFQL